MIDEWLLNDFWKTALSCVYLFYCWNKIELYFAERSMLIHINNLYNYLRMVDACILYTFLRKIREIQMRRRKCQDKCSFWDWNWVHILFWIKIKIKIKLLTCGNGRITMDWFIEQCPGETFYGSLTCALNRLKWGDGIKHAARVKNWKY